MLSIGFCYAAISGMLISMIHFLRCALHFPNKRPSHDPGFAASTGRLVKVWEST